MADGAQRFQNDDIYVDYQKNRSEVNSVSEQFVAEENRREQSRAAETPWKKWGPYLTERQWGTVREDYSENGNAWDYFSHDQARSRAYRWGEDGLAGISDDQQFLCFALALWNGQDPILKKRLTVDQKSFSATHTGVTWCWFYEYFHGDRGAGTGASHQTGWTGLVAWAIKSRAVLNPAKVLEKGFDTVAMKIVRSY